MKIIMITGASSGIGREFALQMDKSFSSVDEFWLIGRNEEALQQTANSIQNHKTRILAKDLNAENAIDDIVNLARDNKVTVAVLVNAAGYGIMGEFAKANALMTAGMINTNCRALTMLTQAMLPYMRRNSRIIQIASSAGFLPQQDFAVYAASKAYVLSFSRAINEELKDQGIYVTAVCPGPVDTPFFDIAEKEGSTLAIKKYTMVSAERVVNQALRDSYYKKTLSVCSLPIKSVHLISKLLPTDQILQVMSVLKKRGM